MTPFQLRRLALQATRRSELWPVLQDALLESPAYGRSFERAMAEAHVRCKRNLGTMDPISFVVVFDPLEEVFSHDFGLFDIYAFYSHDFDWSVPHSALREFARSGRIPVYAAHPPGARVQR